MIFLESYPLPAKSRVKEGQTAMQKSIWILALALSIPGLAEAKVTSLEGATLGEHWYGPNYSLEDLKGRVVMFELWGYN
jgi:hypothetical protein